MVSPEGTQDGGKWAAYCQAHIAVSHCSRPNGVPEEAWQASWRSKMGRKDASTIKLPVDQYRKQIGKQDYKKTKPILRATKLKAEAKKTAIGIKEVGLVLAAILALLLAFYAFFYLRLSSDVDPDLEPDED
ncbi:triple QxxK/R motif-containing protein isoform X1 [Odocoileus virginianus]|uniref:Triple QxxK/R motif-containing protein n=1 Tax=Odocoileus virginianus TaxID=9874 RepID=A0A6J0XSV5_ODOVR|nr:triple QxxK/R motif-containing protein isoform X1 [Odocoileus virginianus texanus]XP_020751970.1 triple QxxK/R motif-containing protein isoform X1 [Odocoileus virginianus texanus]